MMKLINKLNTLEALFTKSKRAKIYIITIIALATAILIHQLLSKPTSSDLHDEKIVEVDIVKRSSIKQIIEVIGTIKAAKQTVLNAKSQGILEILSQPGQFVEKGTLIAKISNKDIEKSYKILKEAESIAEIQFKRLHSLSKSKVLSSNAVEEKKSTLLEAQKKISDIKISLETLKISAPFDGIIGIYKFREGAEVTTGNPIVTFYDPKALLVEFELPAPVAQQVNEDSYVVIYDKEYKLTHVQKMLDEETNMCPAYVANIDCVNCMIGTAVNLSLIITEKPNAIVIPFVAIFIKNQNTYVYTVKENKAILTPITLGIRDRKLIEVTSGLQEQDQIIIYGHNRIHPNATVTIYTPDETLKVIQ